MRVAWVQDLNIWTVSGGAQETDREIVKFGMKKGHEIELITPENFGVTQDMKADLVVFSNTHNLMNAMPNEVLAVATRFPYIAYHHDYPCRYRLYFPMQPKCMRCRYIPQWKTLYANSKLNLFMSPLHKDSFLSIMPEVKARPFEYAPSAINPDDYRSPEKIEPKPNTVIGVNSLYGFKGKDNVVKFAEQHRELHFLFIGGTEGTVLLPPNCEYSAFLPLATLVQKYSESEYFIHLPANPQPCERTIVEYAIANPTGKFIVNNLIGILSYPGVVGGQKINKEKLIEIVSTSAKHFWEVAEKLV